MPPEDAPDGGDVAPGGDELPEGQEPPKGREPPEGRVPVEGQAPPEGQVPVVPRRDAPPGSPGWPSAEAVVASPHRRAPARFSWVGIALLGGAAVVAFTVTLGIFLPAIGALGSATPSNPAALPSRITVCGRDWTKDALGRTFTRDEVMTRTEAEPIVVSTGPNAPCPPEVATGGDPDGMATTIYVKAGDDAFVPYDLVGAP